MRTDTYIERLFFKKIIDPAKIALDALTAPSILTGRERRVLRRKNERK